MRSLLLLSCCLLAVWAQGADRPLITVTGEAEVFVVPDEVQLTFGVETRETTLAAAKTGNDQAVAAVIAVAKEAGVAEELIQTSHIRVDPVFDRRKGATGMTVVGYRVNKTVAVTVREVERFGGILSGALEAGANRVQGVEFRSTERRQHEAAARIEAMKNAKAKAEAMAGVLGQTVGKAFSIREGGARVQPPQFQRAGLAMVAADGGVDPADTVSLGRIRIDASVIVDFDLQ